MWKGIYLVWAYFESGILVFGEILLHLGVWNAGVLILKWGLLDGG